MTAEERRILYDKMHSGVRMFADKIEKISREKDNWSMAEMYQMADILKDMAETEKCLAKAHYMYSEHPEEVY